MKTSRPGPLLRYVPEHIIPVTAPKLGFALPSVTEPERLVILDQMTMREEHDSIGDTRSFHSLHVGPHDDLPQPASSEFGKSCKGMNRYCPAVLLVALPFGERHL